jgi:hypothetical protein
MPYAMGKGDIPGAVVVVVKDGQILTERGYGYSNVEKKTKVDPKTTLFRPGSVSKLFTWTALMQQVEQGKVDLNADVNKYIDFKIPPYEGKPITVLNLMTHTPGFEEQVKDLITVTPSEYVALDALLKRWVPKRLRAWNYAGLFELRREPRWLHHPAHVGRALRRLCRTPHLRAPGDGAFELQPAAPRQPQAVDGRGLCFGKEKPYGYSSSARLPRAALRRRATTWRAS